MAAHRARRREPRLWDAALRVLLVGVAGLILVTLGMTTTAGVFALVLG